MGKLVRFLPAAILAVALLSQATAQQPGGKAEEPAKKAQKDYSNSSLVVKMMAFNKKKDGKLTKDEVTDPRLHRLFDMADTNKDGVVTKEELMALAAKLEAEIGPGGDGPGGPGGRGPGGPGDRGPGGPGGPGGRGPGGPPAIGQVMPEFVQEALNLKDDQKKQVVALQKDVDAKLDKIFTDEQQKQFKAMKDNPGRGGPGGRGPGGPGGPGGDRGPDGPGDRGPGGRGGRGPGGPGGPGGRGPGGPPALGQILPDFAQDALKLKDDQKKQVADLQKDVDTKVAKILMDDQNKQLKEMKDNPRRGGPGGRGPGGPGDDRGPGGRGPGGPGGE